MHPDLIRATKTEDKPLTLDEFQDAAGRTAGVQMGRQLRLTIPGLGVAGEAGEVADIIKKHVGHAHPLDETKLKKELGDVLWYVADLARTLGVRLSDVAQMNIDKLKERYPEGFSTERSINRTF
jgi:NTP pyrophosphatase (non-canonical NTP hydrolase)